MSQKQFLVQLNEQERHRLQQIVRSGKDKARKITRCRILLLADGPNGKTDQEISDALNVCLATIFYIRRRYSQEGLEHAIGEGARSGSLRNSKAKLQRRSQRSLAAVRQPVKPNGACVYWLIVPWNSRLLTPYRIKA